MKVVKTNNSIQLLKNHLAITKSLLPAVSDNLFLELLDKENIIKAINLAINARLNLDPFFNPELLDEITIKDFKDNYLSKIKNRLHNNSFELSDTYRIKIPKNRIDTRSGIYLNFEDYILKFLVALVIHKHSKIPSCVFGGNDEIFNIIDNDVFKEQNNEFLKWQTIQLFDKGYQYVLAIDVKSYYHNIASNILMNKIVQEINCEDNSDIMRLTKSLFSSLSIASWPDHYIQNFYLKELDLLLLNNKKVSYGRITDDIRIFTYTEQDAIDCLDVIIEYFEEHRLEINNDKAFVTKPLVRWGSYETSLILNKNEFEKFEFENLMRLHATEPHIYSIINVSTLPRQFFTFNDYLKGKEGYLVSEKEVSEYINNLCSNSNIITEFEIDNLFKILRYFYGSYRFYIKIVDIIFSAFINTNTKLNEYILQSIIDFIKNDVPSYDKESYRSYLLLRKMFFDAQTGDFHFANKLNKLIHIDDLQDLLSQKLLTSKNELFAKLSIYILKRFFNDKNRKSYDDPTYWIDLIENKISIGYTNFDDYRSDIYKSLQKLFPDKVVFLEKEISSIFVKKKKYESDYKKIIVLVDELFKSTNKPTFFFDRAFSYNELKNYGKALEDYNSYLLVYTNDTSALNNRALIKEKVKDFTGALADYNRALELKPNNELYIRNKQALIEKINKAE